MLSLERVLKVVVKGHSKYIGRGHREFFSLATMISCTKKRKFSESRKNKRRTSLKERDDRQCTNLVVPV